MLTPHNLSKIHTNGAVEVCEKCSLSTPNKLQFEGISISFLPLLNIQQNRIMSFYNAKQSICNVIVLAHKKIIFCKLLRLIHNVVSFVSGHLCYYWY